MTSFRSKHQQTRITPASVSMFARLHCAANLLAVLALGACSKAPAGFDAVPAVDGLLKQHECPELRGTFNLASAPVALVIDPNKPPNTYGLPVVLTFKKGTTQTEAWWVVPRQNLLSFARALRTDEPERYARWRNLMLMDYMPQQLHPMVDGYLADIADVGPPGPVNTGFQPGQCQANWMLAATSIDFNDAASNEGDKMWRETWLAHDTSGALLVKRLSFKAGFVILPRALRRVRSADYSRFEPMPFQAPTPFVAADLPAVTR